MNAKDKAVRARLAMEDRLYRESEAAKRKSDAEEAASLRLKYDGLIEIMDAEAARIAAVLEDADWSMATMKTFTFQNWWLRKLRVKIRRACLLIVRGGGPSLWIRSDGLLLIGSPNDNLIVRPSLRFYCPTREWHSQDVFDRMRSVIERLASFTSLESLPKR